MTLADIGVYGLGTMGSALALNLAEKGFEVAVSNREADWIPDFLGRAGSLAEQLQGHADLKGFVAALKTPRVILFMIPSGEPLDAMIETVAPFLQSADTLIDGGNADFADTNRRVEDLERTGVHFVGMGVSGGGHGARHGPSLMVGGSDHAWTQLRPMVESIAARFENDPCVDHLGPNGAGHFVKTVHNGIEYADMQMIAEVYGILRDKAGMSASRVAEVFDAWSDGPLSSYLVEITAKVLAANDGQTGTPIVDQILDQAGQKGTGRWTVIEALKLGQSASAIEAAVGARSWSAERDARRMAEGLLDPGSTMPISIDLALLESALVAGRILSHGQGFRVLAAASDAFDWSLDLARIAEIWRAGCIIRSRLLDDIATAFRSDPPFGHLVLSDTIRPALSLGVPALRKVVSGAIGAGQPVPALAGALSWYDSLRNGRGTTNLIQAQRDFFGTHGFERLDDLGAKHHGPWA
ncbi:MAG: NADP-dependent phosphogluconate dehydrogenase [Paracoccaceae bacterium]